MSSAGNIAVDGGGTLAYEIHGDGPPILLVRPLGGTSALWGEFRDRLADEFRVISYDLRGTGGSRPSSNARTAGHRARDAASRTRDLARDAIAMLDHLGIERALVFGISLGSMIAQWLAIDHSSRVKNLCLASTCARGIEATHAGIKRELALASNFLRRRDEVEPHVVGRVLSARFRKEHPDEVARIEATVRADPSSRTTLAMHALAALRHDARDRLATITAPTLVLAGSEDKLLGPDLSREVSAAIPDAVFDIIDGAGHDLTLERPVETAARVARFFR